MFFYEFQHMDTPVLANQLCADTRCSLEDLQRAMGMADESQRIPYLMMSLENCIE